MDKDFFKYLPSEIVFDIFCRLPIRRIGICRCVCNSWRNLVGSREFASLHLSQSAPCLVFCSGWESYDIFEFNDDADHHKLFTKFTFPRDDATLQGSTNGLLFLRRQYYGNDDLYVCNPITRDYVKLPTDFSSFRGCKTATFGFGASRASSQHKVVGIFHGFKRDGSGRVMRAGKSECRVYTLGTRSWRRINTAAASSLNYGPPNYGGMYAGTFVKGNLHWLVKDDEVNRTTLISRFDLETEVFTTFSPPPRCGRKSGGLCVLENCLSFCEKRRGSNNNGMIIWFFKDEKCWRKGFVITTSVVCRSRSMYPVKVFGDGDILIAPFMVYYSTKTKKTSQVLEIFDSIMGKPMIYTPSFLSLKSFGNSETATSF